MAGRLTIQRIPRGLTDALAMKASGDVPVQLAETVAATFEVGYLYMQESRRTLNVTGPNPALGYQASANATVPSGEMWLITCASVNIIAATATGSMALGYADPTGAMAFCLSDYVTYAASGQRAVGAVFTMGELLLTPGYSLGVWYDNVAGGAPTGVAIRADYYRLSI